MMGPIPARIEEMIAVHGHAVLGIFADPQRGLPGFSYSIGLQDQGFPELILSGLAPEHARAIINDCAAWLIARAKAPQEGEIIEGFLAGGFQMRFRELSEAEIGANLLMACRRSERMGREAPKAFQMIYQDPERRWPEDKGYSCPMALMLAQSEEETKQ